MGFTAVENMLSKSAGQFCVGDEFSVADCFLLPQVVNARKYGVDMNKYPLILKIEENMLKLSAVQDALPQNQPDAPKQK